MLRFWGIVVGSTVVGAYPDYFTYGESDFGSNTFGPADWDLVRCRNVKRCVSWFIMSHVFCSHTIDSPDGRRIGKRLANTFPTALPKNAAPLDSIHSNAATAPNRIPMTVSNTRSLPFIYKRRPPHSGNATTATACATGQASVV